MTPLVQNVTTILSLATIVADIVIFIAFIIIYVAWAENKSAKKLLQKIAPHALLIAFMLSLAAPLGSLFYSQIAGFAPCEFCWWQRIFAYPLVLITGYGLWYIKIGKKKYTLEESQKRNFLDFIFNLVLIFSLIGAVIAAYHSYGQLVDTSVLPSCAATGVSCAKLYFLDFGYVTIPTMSLTSFLLIIMTAIIYKIGKNKA